MNFTPNFPARLHAEQLRGPTAAVRVTSSACAWRALAVTAALLTSGAHAGEGLPVVATFAEGGWVRGDFTRPSGGWNTFTVELPSVDAHATVRLHLRNADGRTLDVTVQTLPASAASADAHAIADGHDGALTATSAHDEEGVAATEAHGGQSVPGAEAHDAHAPTGFQAPVSVDAHVHAPDTPTHADAPPTTDPELTDGAHDASHDEASSGFNGWARVPLTAGRWTMQAVVTSPTLTFNTAFTTERGGPSAWYLLVTGALIVGFTGFGTYHRHLAPRKVPRS